MEGKQSRNKVKKPKSTIWKKKEIKTHGTKELKKKQKRQQETKEEKEIYKKCKKETKQIRKDCK